MALPPRRASTASNAPGARARVWRAGGGRGALLFGLWSILAGVGVGDLIVGAAAAALAAWVSLQLLPATPQAVDPVAATRLGVHFLTQSIVAGVDVAWRVFHPRLQIRPGFVRYPARCPPGLFRNAFTAFTSLQPGTVPAGGEGDTIVYHCIDVEQPVAAQLAAEEGALAQIVRHD
jgi:multicomponent Na+:H+ antiporter subunit E